MEKEWRDGIEPKPGVSYSATVDIYVEDDYVPGEVKVNFPVRAVVTSEGREYTTECEIPVANLDMQAEKTAAKKTAAGTDKELQQVFAELRGKNTLAVDSMLDYYLEGRNQYQHNAVYEKYAGERGSICCNSKVWKTNLCFFSGNEQL